MSGILAVGDMNKRISGKNVDITTTSSLDGLLGQLRALIQSSRRQALRAIDVVQVQTCWSVGRHIVEFEQGGAGRAQYGSKLLCRLAERLLAEFGKGFDERNLRHMRAFFQAFPIWNAVRTELSWTHYRALIRIDNEKARQWYLQECIEQNWSARALERQINVLYYERLLSCKDKQAVQDEAQSKLTPLKNSIQDYLRDPYVLDFLDLPDTRYLENDLEQGIIDNPTIGLILCSQKSEAVVKYSVLTDSKQLFAAKYLSYLPSEEELRLELERERILVQERLEQ